MAIGALAVAAGLWISGLHHVSATSVGHWGLLLAEPLTWYLGLALALITAATVALRAQRGQFWLLAPALLVLILIIHGTPAIEYALPRYDWTYKHIGIVDALQQHRLPRLLDIYYDWPGFFSAVLWLHDATGLSLLTMAKWAPPFNEVVATAGVWYFATGVYDDRRTAALATLLYLVGNWIAQDYFSPQGIAYGLFLPVVGALVRMTSRSTAAADRRGLVAVIVLGWTAILVTHQLTPVELWLDIAAILLVSGKRAEFLRRPAGWAVLMAFGISEILWLVLALPYLHKAGYALFTSFDTQGSAGTPDIPSIKSMAFAVRSYSVDGLYFGFFAVGGLYGLRRLRRSQSARLNLALVMMPVLTRLVQNYGGEGNLRTYLFALPFLACLVAELSLTGHLPRVRRTRVAPLRTIGIGWRRLIVINAVVGMITIAFLIAYYGQDEVNVVGRSDLATMRWFYAHATPGTDPVYLAPYVPTRARYLDFPVATDVGLLTEAPTFVSRFAKGFRPAVAVSYLQSLKPPVDLILTASQQRYLDYFGIMTPQRYGSFVRGLKTESGLTLIYSRGGSEIWKVGPARKVKRSPLLRRLDSLLNHPRGVPRLVRHVALSRRVRRRSAAR